MKFCCFVSSFSPSIFLINTKFFSNKFSKQRLKTYVEKSSNEKKQIVKINYLCTKY